MSQKCVLQVGMVGLSHKSAELPFLELFSRAAKTLKGQQALFFDYPSIVLSTCNRTEIYFGAADLPHAHGDLLSFLRPNFDVPFEHRLYSFFGLDCFHHLGRVTAGLDSAVIGESEIQGQVKQAYLEACQRQKLTASLHYLFQKSLKVGKTVRNSMPSREVELPEAVVQLGEEKLGRIQERSVLLVGYSKLNRLILPLLKRRGMSRVQVATRHPEKVVECAACERSEIERWRAYDWVICAAECDEPLLASKEGSYTLLFDLGVPRNIDPALKQDHTVSLYNIEEIHQWIQAREESSVDRLAFSERLLKTEVGRLARIYRQKVVSRELVG